MLEVSSHLTKNCVRPFLFLFFLLPFSCLAQEVNPHHERHPLRLAVLIGHAAVPNVEDGGVLWVPAWGLDLDVHVSKRWSLGWHSDVEIENYLIATASGQRVELQTPVVSTIDIFYRLSNNLVVGLGLGTTYERGMWQPLWRIGLEGEVPLNDRWEFTPTMFVDQRNGGHAVWTVALGVAHYM